MSLNLEYYRTRLENPELLDIAMLIPSGDIAVPVGGKRRGGYVGVISRAEGKQVVARMRHTPDLYPSPVYMGTSKGWPPSVCYGEPVVFEEMTYEDTGRYYGYKDREIERFVKRLAHYDATGDWLPWELF